MKLSEIIKLKSASSTKTAESNETLAQLKNEGTLRVNQQIKALVPGQTIIGEVIGKNGGDIQLRLAEDLVFLARLEGEMSIDLGKLMTFQVKNNGSTLVLSPLFENLATDANVYKALEMAGISVSEQSVKMTESMMQQGMSIDKASLQSVFRDLTINPQATLANILQLHQLQMKVTSENLAMLDNYNAMRHQLITGMVQVTDEIPVEFQLLLEEGNRDVALKLYLDLAHVLTDEGSVAGGDGNPQGSLVQQEMMQMLDLSLASEMTALTPEQIKLQGNQNLLSHVLSNQEMEAFVDQIKALDEKGEIPELKDLLSTIQSGTATTWETLKVLSSQSIYSDVDISRNVKLASLFSGREYTQILKAEILQQWLLQPEELQDDKSVEELYQRLGKQLEGIREALSQSGRAENAAMKSVTNMRNNLEFMNQLNQVYNYVQLPLKMNGRETHGELHVYTNKRHMAQEDGSISALLHLDMEHVGPVDVYVTMQNQKVNTKFYLRDEDMIDFIGEHIYLLNDRLEKRGYTMQCELLQRPLEDKEGIFLDNLQGGEKNMKVLSQYAFDVRA